MDTPLNKAHIYARKAFSHIGKQEAKDYLEKCIECFSAAAKQSSSPKAIESIEIQKLYYEKQLNLLNLKKTLYDKCVDRIQKDETIKLDINEQIDNATNIQLDLLQNIQMADKALEELTKNANTTELQQINTQFNILLCKLFKFVDETVRENVALKDRKQDEEIKISQDNQSTKVQEVMKNVQDASPKCAISDESDEDEEMHDLPPLECPEFDLDK